MDILFYFLLGGLGVTLTLSAIYKGDNKVEVYTIMDILSFVLLVLIIICI